MKSSKTRIAITLGVASLAAFAGPNAQAAKKATKPKPTTAVATATTTAPVTATPKTVPAIKVGTIPDQDPAKLARQFALVADYLAAKSAKKVEFVPVTDYAAAVTAFRVGDLDLVWFGGLTGVQAQKQVPDAAYLGQRDIDAKFKSVFIANTSARIPPVDSVLKLRFLKGLSFTFGSESSTSGRLMPQFFLDEGGVELQDFKGQPGFSGSHDKTIRLVETGAFDAGALNKAVWDSAVAKKTVDTDKVRVIFETPTYFDYHWLARGDMDAKFGSGTTATMKSAILKLSASVPTEAAILDLFSATSFIETTKANYGQIEKTAKGLKLLT
jgi:phosphonate transport system substrate-binding protein